jgi:hypothetical protein
MTVAVAGLVFCEPDWGTALLLGATAAGVCMVAGTRPIHMVPLGVMAVGALAWLMAQDPIRRARWISYLDPERFRDGIGWQQWHSVLSVGAGGLWGRGIGAGSHKFGYVPEQATDFIFSLVGEEMGFVGSLFVLGLFVLIGVGGWRIAWLASDPFGKLLALGCTLMIELQAFINLGVATSVLPNKGIPLPFVSYGGSDLIAMLALVGLLGSVALQPARREVRIEPEPVTPGEAPEVLARRRRLLAVPLAGGLGGGAIRRWWDRRRGRRGLPFAGLAAYQQPPVAGGVEAVGPIRARVGRAVIEPDARPFRAGGVETGVASAESCGAAGRDRWRGAANPFAGELADCGSDDGRRAGAPTGDAGGCGAGSGRGGGVG